MIARAGSDVAVDPFAEPNAHHQPNNAVFNLDRVRQDMSWPFREPAAPEASLPAFRPTDATRGYPYPMELDIPSGPMGQTADHSLRVARPVANDFGPGANDSFPVLQPQTPRPLSQRSATQTRNVRTNLPHRPTAQRPTTHGNSPATADYYHNRPRYSPPAPPKPPHSP